MKYSKKIGMTYRIATPVQALRLAEDIQSLNQIMWSIDNIDPGNITDDTALGRKILRVTLQQIRHCKLYAEAKLRREYLSKEKIERTKVHAVK